MNEQFTTLNSPLAPHGTLIGRPEDAFDYSVLQVVPDFEAAVPEPIGNKLITTINLTIDTCRWPFGDLVEPGIHYCGELPLIGRPYCDLHNSKSYNKPRSKKSLHPSDLGTGLWWEVAKVTMMLLRRNAAHGFTLLSTPA